MSKPPKDPENNSFVKWAVRLGKLSNESELGRSIQHNIARHFSYNWIKPFISKRILAHGLDHYKAHPPAHAVIAAANHRSFFDAYIYTLTLWAADLGWPKNLRFPVRSNFFYDNPVGVFVNYFISGGAMYPPVFRDPAKTKENQMSFDDIISFLKLDKSLVGVHPEGRRNKGDDPYSFLPAQPGIGKIVVSSDATVIPIFVNGASNDFIDTMGKGLKKGTRQTDPVIVVYGKPVDVSQFKSQKARASVYKKCSDHILEHIAACGETEKRLRQECLDGSIDDNDPRWVFNF